MHVCGVGETGAPRGQPHGQGETRERERERENIRPRLRAHKLLNLLYISCSNDPWERMKAESLRISAFSASQRPPQRAHQGQSSEEHYEERLAAGTAEGWRYVSRFKRLLREHLSASGGAGRVMRYSTVAAGVGVFFALALL